MEGVENLAEVDSKNDVNCESIGFLKFLTTVFRSNCNDVDILIGYSKSFTKFLNVDIGATTIVTREEIKQQLLIMGSFRKSVKYAITNVIETILSYIQMNDCFENNLVTRPIHYRNITKAATLLKNYLVAVHPHVKITYIEESLCNFITTLMQLLKNTDACPMSNIYILSTLTDILLQFKEVNFLQNVILKEVDKNLQVCEINLLSFSTTALFELAFYEKLMCNLLVLKELLLYSVEQHELYQRNDYDLNCNVVMKINTVLSSIRNVVPEYLKRSVQECLNLINE